MSNYLKIYDFFISSREGGTNTNYAKLATNNHALRANIPNNVSDNIQRQLIFNSFLTKMSSDLNTEVLKSRGKNIKIIKKSNRFENGVPRVIELNQDYNNKLIYGLLYSGKQTEKSVLEKINDDGSNILNQLNGHRIYDDFFFLLHISFDTNIARLFILTRKGNVLIDSIFKNYLKNTLFTANGFSRTKCGDFIEDTYRQQVLNRSIVNSILISKADTIISENDGIEYEVEIKLKPKKHNNLIRYTQDIVENLRNGKVVIGNDETYDDESELKFNIKDPTTNQTKTFSFGDDDNFKPKLIYSDEETLEEGTDNIDIEKVKNICMEFLQF